MAVYVDYLRNWGWKLRGKPILSCHMIADTVEELHEMADKIGLKREWFQDKKDPHYDLTKSRREEAIKNGAIVLTLKQLYYKLLEIREN